MAEFLYASKFKLWQNRARVRARARKNQFFRLKSITSFGHGHVHENSNSTFTIGIIIFVFFLSFSSCNGPKVVTLNQYNDVYIGERQNDLEYHLGKPYRVKDLPGGGKEYIYIERLRISAHKELFRTYYITVLNGKVSSKKMEESKTPSIEFNY